MTARFSARAALAKVYQRMALASVYSGRMGGPNGRALKAWIAENMPDLDRELRPLTLDQVRVRLNQLTGCTVLPTDAVELSCAVFLAALKAQHEKDRGEA